MKLKLLTAIVAVVAFASIMATSANAAWGGSTNGGVGYSGCVYTQSCSVPKCTGWWWFC